MLCLFGMLAVHGPALGGFFQADDFLWLRHSDWASTRAAFTGSWGLGTAFRPLTRLSFYLDGQLFGRVALGWHATNLVLHAATTFLVAQVGRAARQSWTDSVAAAMLFMAMPVQWESVDWISGRTGPLSALFMLIGILAWLPSPSSRDGHRWVAWLVLAQILALLCYEPACMLPVIMAVLAPMLVCAGILSTARAWRGIGVATAAASLTWAGRAVALGTATGTTDIAPANFWLGALFDVEALLSHLELDFGGSAAIAVAGLLAAGLIARRTRGAVATLLIAAILLYAPFLHVDGFTERFIYLAAIPGAFALVKAADALKPCWASPCLLILVIVSGVFSHRRAEGMRAAGQTVRDLLTQIAAIPADGATLVFTGLPSHAGVYYLFWGGFEDAAALWRPGSLVVRDTVPPASRGRTRVYRYDALSNAFVETSRRSSTETNKPL